MCPPPSQVAKLPFVINDGQWHHICVTWTTRDGVWEAYQDGTQGGNGENLAPYHPIKPQGVLVLGQEQVGAWGLGLMGMLVAEPEEGQPGWLNRDQGEKEGVGRRRTWSPHSQKEPREARYAVVWAKSCFGGGFSGGTSGWALSQCSGGRHTFFGTERPVCL